MIQIFYFPELGIRKTFILPTFSLLGVIWNDILNELETAIKMAPELKSNQTFL
jgi:hypothetical protein